MGVIEKPISTRDEFRVNITALGIFGLSQLICCLLFSRQPQYSKDVEFPSSIAEREHTMAVNGMW